MLNPSDDHQWMQLYHQQQQQIIDEAGEGGEFNSMSEQKDGIPVSSSSLQGPYPSNSKPVRRRSRASKRTPTTVLNANTHNFRALVQKFTGCPSSTALSFKGPVNLSFSNNNNYQDQPPFPVVGSNINNFPPYNNVISSSPASVSVSSSSYGQHISYPHQSQSQSQRGSSSLSEFLNTTATGSSSTDGFIPQGQKSSAELEMPLSLGQGGFAAMEDSDASLSLQGGLPSTPDNNLFSW